MRHSIFFTASLAIFACNALITPADAQIAPLVINGTTFNVSDIGSDGTGPLVDLDGDGNNDFQLGFRPLTDDSGSQLFISAPLPVGDGPANSILGEFEGVFVSSFNNGPGAAPFNSAGVSISSLEFLEFGGSLVNVTEVLAGTYDSDGTSTGFFEGNFNATSPAVLYDSESFDDLLTLGNTFVAVFDIPGGSPYVATIDLEGDFDADNNLTSFTVATGSNFQTLGNALGNAVPEPSSTTFVALVGLVLVGRRRN